MSQRGLKMHQTEVGLGLNWHTDQSLPLGGAVVLRTLFFVVILVAIIGQRTS